MYIYNYIHYTDIAKFHHSFYEINKPASLYMYISLMIDIIKFVTCLQFRVSTTYTASNLLNSSGEQRASRR